MDSKGNEVETVANQSQEDEKKPDNSQDSKPDTAETAENPDEESQAGEEQSESGEINDDDNVEDNSGVQVKDSEIPTLEDEKEEDLDLPDDMNLDDLDDTGEKQNPNDMDIDSKEEPETIEEEGTMDQSEPIEELKPDGKEDDNSTGLEELEKIQDEEAEVNPEPEENSDEANPEVQNGGEDPVNEENEIKDSETADNTLKQQSKPSKEADLGVEGDGADPIQDASSENPNQSEQVQDQNSEFQEASDTGTSGKNSNQKQEKSQSNENLSDPNPRRNLGDATKEWMSRLKSIQEGTNRDDSSEEPENADDQMDFEHVVDENSKDDLQALDIATIDQAKESNVDRHDKMDETIEESDDTEEHSKSKSTKPQTEENTSAEGKKTKPSEKKSNSNNGDVDMESEEEDLLKELTERLDVSDEPKKRERFIREEMEYQDQERPVIDYEKLRMELDQVMQSWRANRHDDQESMKLWTICCELTRDLSFDLCEQLRLIMEPTLATKLKGDYKTGKRLNMRKVIPYIASEYKKDKIWMRRTKPSKRTYQIMIAIDDSKSMDDSKSIQLAYQSLTLISKALSQLEAGDISVVGFGEDTKLLHPFEKQFSDDAGSNVIRQFTFDQNKTNVGKMMETCMSILSQSRSGGDLWQLQIVISDGICEDHDRIRSLVRRAAEDRIMVVFLVLDNRVESITKMTCASFQDVDGNMVLNMNRYMDTFPFDYFVTLGEIERLPEVLSECLRQYFSLVSQ